MRSVYPSSLAVGYGSVWVAGADYGGSHPALWRIDPQTLQVTQTIPLGKSHLPGADFGLATGDGAVWLTDYDRGTLLRIDPTTGVIVSTIGIGGHPRASPSARAGSGCPSTSTAHTGLWRTAAPERNGIDAITSPDWIQNSKCGARTGRQLVERRQPRQIAGPSKAGRAHCCTDNGGCVGIDALVVSSTVVVDVKARPYSTSGAARSPLRSRWRDLRSNAYRQSKQPA